MKSARICPIRGLKLRSVTAIIIIDAHIITILTNTNANLISLTLPQHKFKFLNHTVNTWCAREDLNLHECNLTST